MPRLARSLLGCLGFSCQSTTSPFSSSARMPKRCASPIGTRLTATVTSARLRRWTAARTAGSPSCRCGRRPGSSTMSPGCWRIVSRLTSTASAVPRYHSDGRLRAMNGCSRRMPPVVAVEVPRPARADVVVERARVVLRQHDDVVDVRVDAVAEREVDDPVLAGERHRGLGADARQDRQPLPFPAGEDDGSDPLHGAMLHPSGRGHQACSAT